MDQIIEASSQRARNGRTAYRRVSPPRWPFMFRGLVPILGLLGVALFGVTRFANHWIEQVAREGIREALDASGHEWAELTLSGQLAHLSGSAPSPSEGDDAVQVARTATCPTWLGPKVCVMSVSGAFGAPEVDVAWPDLLGAVDGGLLVLTGAVPDESARAGVLEVARRAIQEGRVTDVVDELSLTGGGAPPAFDVMAGRVAEVASLCDTGEAGLTGGTFHVMCRVPRALEAEIRALLAPPLPGGSLGEVRLVVAEDADACERDLAAVLENNRIEFGSSSATITPAAGPLLDRIAETARTCPGVLQVEGHTDSSGDADANQLLSGERARAVRDALVTRGVPVERLLAVGFGETNPVASNDTDEGRALNRRIEFRVILDAG